MFSETEIDRLITAMRANAVTHLQIEGPDGSLQLGLPSSTTPPSVGSSKNTPPAAPKRVSVPSPAIGLFQPRGSDDGLNAVQKGDRVNSGDILGYVTTGLARVPVVASCDGHLTRAPLGQSTRCGFGDDLFEVDPLS